MIKTIDELKNANSWEEMRAKLGEYLGLKHPVSSGVLKRSIEDERFAHYLMTTKNNPQYLQQFLDDPKNEAYETQAEKILNQHNTDFSNIELISKATKSMWKWGKTGFKKASKELFNKRMDVCLGCPYLTDPPEDKWVYKVPLAKSSNPSICSACGCVASKKAWTPTESCPVVQDENPNLTKWGDPVHKK